MLCFENNTQKNLIGSGLSLWLENTRFLEWPYLGSLDVFRPRSLPSSPSELFCFFCFCFFSFTVPSLLNTSLHFPSESTRLQSVQTSYWLSIWCSYKVGIPKLFAVVITMGLWVWWLYFFFKKHMIIVEFIIWGGHLLCFTI